MPERIREVDLVVPALRFAAAETGGKISTTDLRRRLEELFRPAGEDAQIIPGKNFTKFSQIVRNMVSNRQRGRNMIHGGFAEYADGHITITDKGRELLTFLGYKTPKP